MRLSIYKCTGAGYEAGWWTNFKGRYRLYKGARNTKKSYDIIGLEVLDKILSDKRRNVLILRNTMASHRFSTFSTLAGLIAQPDISNPKISLSRFFKINDYAMTITYLPTGQMIIFKGIDDPQKLQGIRTSMGYLTDVYVEEAFELKEYEAWRKIDGSIRGKLPEGLFHQITFCFNSWNKNHWLYDEFFKGRLEDNLDYLIENNYQDYKDENEIINFGRGIYLHISTYKINEFRDMEIYDTAMEQLKAVAPEIYKVEALGMWGNSTESTYPEYNDELIISHTRALKFDYFRYSIGIDTGLSDGEGRAIKNGRIRSATTMQLVGLTRDFEKLICIDEYFHTNEGKLTEQKTEPQLMEEIIDKIIEWRDVTYKEHPTLMKGIICVYVDSGDKGFRQGLELIAKNKGLYNVSFQASTKKRIQTRVDFIRLIMAWKEFLISEKCQNLKREIRNSRKGEHGEVRENFDDHAVNANEYAWATLVGYLRRWKTFKEH